MSTSSEPAERSTKNLQIGANTDIRISAAQTVHWGVEAEVLLSAGAGRSPWPKKLACLCYITHIN